MKKHRILTLLLCLALCLALPVPGALAEDAVLEGTPTLTSADLCVGEEALWLEVELDTPAEVRNAISLLTTFGKASLYGGFELNMSVDGGAWQQAEITRVEEGDRWSGRFRTAELTGLNAESQVQVRVRYRGVDTDGQLVYSVWSETVIAIVKIVSDETGGEGGEAGGETGGVNEPVAPGWNDVGYERIEALAEAVYNGTLEQDLVLVFHSKACAYCQFYIPSYQDYANENQIPVAAYMYTGVDSGDGALSQNMWLFFSGEIGWPCVVVYHADTGLVTAEHSVRSEEDFIRLVEGMGEDPVQKAGSINGLRWSVTKSGTVTLNSEPGEGEKVVVASYDAEGRMCSVGVIEASGESVPLSEDGVRFSLFCLDGNGSPLCDKVDARIPE